MSKKSREDRLSEQYKKSEERFRKRTKEFELRHQKEMDKYYADLRKSQERESKIQRELLEKLTTIHKKQISTHRRKK